MIGLLSIALLLIAHPAAAETRVAGDREGFSSSFSLGFDSFSEKYSIEDADTLDYLNELRSAVGLGYRHAWGEASSVIQFKDVLTVSDAAVRNHWTTDLEFPTRLDDRLTLSNELSSRGIDPNSELSLSSDYIQDVARIHYRAPINPRIALSFRDRFEVIDFAQEDAYETDYRRNEAGAGLAIESGLDGMLEVAYTRGNRVVPDSSAIDYAEDGVRATWWQGLGLESRIEAESEIEHRRYHDDAVRPGYVMFTGNGLLTVGAGDRLEVRFREELEVTGYHGQSQVYYDRLLQLAGIEAAVNPGSGLELGLEPRYAFLRAEQGSGEDYDEWSAVMSGDWLRIDRFWITGSVEIGRRDYRAADTIDSIFSDYSFVRTNLFATVELGSRTTWNVHLDHEPERHAVEGDDTTTALFSTEVAVRF